MKKTISFFTKGKMLGSTLLLVAAFVLAGAISASAQVLYKPSEAREMIENLRFMAPNPPAGQGQHAFTNEPSVQGSGAASVAQATNEDLIANSRRAYYKLVMAELEEEASHNNSIPGTALALQRAYNKAVPAPGNARYARLVEIHNELVTFLSKR